MSTNLKQQVTGKAGAFDFYSVLCDVSTDATDTAQLSPQIYMWAIILSNEAKQGLINIQNNCHLCDIVQISIQRLTPDFTAVHQSNITVPVRTINCWVKMAKYLFTQHYPAFSRTCLKCTYWVSHLDKIKAALIK